MQIAPLRSVARQTANFERFTLQFDNDIFLDEKIQSMFSHLREPIPTS
jgi:hypothetical protein